MSNLNKNSNLVSSNVQILVHKCAHWKILNEIMCNLHIQICTFSENFRYIINIILYVILNIRYPVNNQLIHGDILVTSFTLFTILIS